MLAGLTGGQVVSCSESQQGPIASISPNQFERVCLKLTLPEAVI